MTKEVQIRGHAAVDANAFIGLEREITIDTTNWEFRIHDGTTPGGFKVLNRNSNDNRYQARSVELDGLLGWEPNERGLVTRLGPANYALRAITVDTAGLGINTNNGYAGDFLISLNDTIEGDRTATGTWTFTDPLIAAGGVVGNFTGDVTGDTTGTHTGNVVGNVTGNLIGDTTGNHIGGLDARGATVQMDDGTIQLSWLSTEALEFIVFAGVPVGACMPFFGEIGDIPANWFLCDGTNGTPDLTDRFVVGAGSSFPADDVGGAENHTHAVTIDSGGSHTHTGTNAGTALSIAQLPAHDHGNGVTNTDADLYCYGSKASSTSTPNSIDDNSANGTLQGLTESVGSGATHTHVLTIDAGGAHTHSGSTAAGSSLPPYYSMIYIMKGA